MTLYGVLGAAILGAFLFIYLFRRLIAIEKMINEKLVELKNLKHLMCSDTERLNRAISRQEEFEANLVTIQNVVLPLPSKLDLLEGKIREQQQQDPQIKLYQKAASMAADGATPEEIASVCDLPVAEASVLVSLHSK